MRGEGPSVDRQRALSHPHNSFRYHKPQHSTTINDDNDDAIENTLHFVLQTMFDKA